MGRRDLRAVANGGRRDFPFEPGADEAGDERWCFFGRTVAYAGEGDEVGVLEMAAQLGCGVDGDGAVAVAPENEGGGIEVVAEGAAQIGHVVMPSLEETQQVGHGAGGAEVIAVGLEALGRVPALGTGHAAEADHLHPFGKPGHEVREHLARH